MARIEEIELLLTDLIGKLGIFGEMLQKLMFTDSFFQKLLADPHLFPEILVNLIFLLNPDFAISLCLCELLIGILLHDGLGCNFPYLKSLASYPLEFGL